MFKLVIDCFNEIKKQLMYVVVFVTKIQKNKSEDYDKKRTTFS
jgi:hypothetical protein